MGFIAARERWSTAFMTMLGFYKDLMRGCARSALLKFPKCRINLIGASALDSFG